MCDHQNGLVALQSDTFNLEEAGKFAKTGGNAKKQLKVLQLNKLHRANLFIIGAAAIISEENKKLRTSSLKQANAIEAQIQAKPPSNNANPKAWSEIFVAGEILRPLNFWVTGSALNEMRAILFGRSEISKPRSDQTWRTFCSVYKHITGIELPKRKRRKATVKTTANSTVERASGSVWEDY